MKYRLLTANALALLLSAVGTVAAEPLVLNGAGMRTRALIGALYQLSLYLPAEMKGAHPKAIIEDGRPMELVMEIRSSTVTRARLLKATSQGFQAAAQSGYSSPKVREFLDQFASVELQKGDTITMRFEKGGLVTLYRPAGAEKTPASETRLGRIASMDLKQALFAIWLGEHPVQESLKESLLGR